MLKYLAAVLSLSLLLPSSSFAAGCADKKGKVIFEDNFADDTGGWSSDPDASFDGELKLRLNDTGAYWLYWNNTFNATTGDFCMEAVAPKAPSQDNDAAIGIGFLITDADNYYVLQWSTNNTIQLYQQKDKAWTKVGDYSKSAGSVQPGSPIVLEVTVNENLITSFFNGTQVGKLRAQIPQSDLKFGVYGGLVKAVGGYTFEFKDMKVTAVQ